MSEKGIIKMEFFECSREDRQDWEDEAKGVLIEDWESACQEIKKILFDENCYSVDEAVVLYLNSRGYPWISKGVRGFNVGAR